MIKPPTKTEENGKFDTLLDVVVGYRRPLPQSTNVSNTDVVDNCQTRRMKRAKLLEIVESALRLIDDEDLCLH